MTSEKDFIIDLFRGKDSRNEKYYFQVIATNPDETTIFLVNHLGNNKATGADNLNQALKTAKKQYEQVIIKEFTACTPGTYGAENAKETHIVDLTSGNNTPKKQENNSILGLFSNPEAVLMHTIESAKNSGRIDYLEEKINDLKDDKSQLLYKVGEAEADNKRLRELIEKLKEEKNDLKWQKEDQFRELKRNHDDELARHKGTQALIQAGVQGLGGFIQKKLGINDTELSGLLGLGDMNQEQNVESSLSAQISNEINNWLQTESEEKAQQFYQIAQSISINPRLFQDVYELSQGIESPEIEEV